MIDLHLHFGETTTASVLFDGATALRMKPPEAPTPFDPNLSLAKLIEVFSYLQARCVEFVGSTADQVTVYRPADLAPRLVELLHAASFAAGFDHLKLVDLTDIMPALLSRPRGNWLVVNASPDKIEAARLSIEPSGKPSHVVELSVPVDVAACENAVISQLERHEIESGFSAALARELVDQYWKSTDSDWSLDAREWRPGGWATASLSFKDAALDAIASRAVNALFERMPASFEDGRVVIVGVAASRVGVLARKFRPGFDLVNPASTDILDAMVTFSRMRLTTSAAGAVLAERASDELLAAIELAFDARTELNPSGIELRRNHSGVYVKLEPGKRHQLNHVPAKWHRKGFAIEITRGEQTERAQLFQRQSNLGTATFSLNAASCRTSAGSLLVTIASPEFATAALVIAKPGADMLVEHFPT